MTCHPFRQFEKVLPIFTACLCSFLWQQYFSQWELKMALKTRWRQKTRWGLPRYTSHTKKKKEEFNVSRFYGSSSLFNGGKHETMYAHVTFMQVKARLTRQACLQTKWWGCPTSVNSLASIYEDDTNMLHGWSTMNTKSVSKKHLPFINSAIHSK